jgi:hypothetical protein
MAAYISLRDSGELSKRELEVLEALQKFGPMTREQIALKTSMKEGSACGRVNALMHEKDGRQPLIEHHDTIANKVTGKPNEVVRLVMRATAPVQLDMLEAA